MLGSFFRSRYEIRSGPGADAFGSFLRNLLIRDGITGDMLNSVTISGLHSIQETFGVRSKSSSGYSLLLPVSPSVSPWLFVCGGRSPGFCVIGLRGG